MERTDATRGDLMIRDKAPLLYLTPLGTPYYMRAQLKTGECSILRGTQF